MKTIFFSLMMAAVAAIGQNVIVPDSLFGTQGYASIAVTLGLDGINAIALQPDGKIVAAGYTGAGSTSDMAVARFNADGTPDLTFGTNGKLTIDYYNGRDEAFAVAVQADGKILIGGTSQVINSRVASVVRLTSYGAIDQTFAASSWVGKGKLMLEGWGPLEVRQIEALGSGKILAAIYAKDSDDVFAMLKLNADGTNDNSFDGNGKAAGAIQEYDNAFAFAIQSNGKLWVVGESAFCSWCTYSFGVVRFNADGSLDTNFSGDGNTYTSVGAGSSGAYDVALQSDGKAIVVGWALGTVSNDMAVVRYNADGSLDNSFSADGMLLVDFDDEDDAAKTVSVQADGKLMLYGTTVSNGLVTLATARLTTDGVLDTTYGIGGKLVVSSVFAMDKLSTILPLADGKILAGGQRYDLNSEMDFGLTRYVPRTIIHVGVEPETVPRVNLYPNPAKGWVTVQASTPIRWCYLTDLLGNMRQIEVHGNQIDVSLLAAGVYILHGAAEATGFSVETKILVEK